MVSNDNVFLFFWVDLSYHYFYTLSATLKKLPKVAFST